MCRSTFRKIRRKQNFQIQFIKARVNQVQRKLDTVPTSAVKRSKIAPVQKTIKRKQRDVVTSIDADSKRRKQTLLAFKPVGAHASNGRAGDSEKAQKQNPEVPKQSQTVCENSI